MQTTGWAVHARGEPMQRVERTSRPGAGEVLIRVAGCGVCHTDLGFYYDGVPTRHPLPLVLGHEISGTVEAAGAGARDWVGRQVVVPAVIPCGACDACLAGRASICPSQIFPGNDVDGGFASHVLVPARGLCPVPDLADRGANPEGLDLASLSVIADAVSTPYQAIRLSGLAAGDLAVFVGAGGIGGFGIQIAAALEATVVAIDVDADRLGRASRSGAVLALDALRTPFREMRDRVRALAEERNIPTWRRRIFETSGTVEGQATAFGLLGPGGSLGVVGYTAAKSEFRLSNLMALDATARGNWGCPPEHYPAVLALVLEGRVTLDRFIEKRPLASIQQAFEDVHARRTPNRIVLVPEP